LDEFELHFYVYFTTVLNQNLKHDVSRANRKERERERESMSKYTDSWCCSVNPLCQSSRIKNRRKKEKDAKSDPIKVSISCVATNLRRFLM
jgi:hypothetical protein